jgi:hypothetical protein
MTPDQICRIGVSADGHLEDFKQQVTASGDLGATIYKPEKVAQDKVQSEVKLVEDASAPGLHHNVQLSGAKKMIRDDVEVVLTVRATVDTRQRVPTIEKLRTATTCGRAAPIIFGLCRPDGA